MDRTRGIGSSDIPVILGLVPGSLMSLYLEKIGEQRTEETEIMRWGTVLETPIAEEWARRNERSIRPGGGTYTGEEDWMLATPDFFDDQGRIVEVKTTSYWNVRRYGFSVPDPYYAQVTWQIGVVSKNMPVKRAVVVCFATDRRHLFEWEVEFNEEYFREIQEKARFFWFDHVVARRPPILPEDDVEPADGEVIATDDLIYMIEQYVAIGQEISMLQKDRELLKQGILAAMGPASIVKSKDGAVLARRTRVVQLRFDTKALSKDHPELYAKYLKEISYTTLKPKISEP